MTIKKSILQEDVTTLNIYALNNGASNCMRHKLIDLQGEIRIFTIIVGEFNISLRNRSSR